MKPSKDQIEMVMSFLREHITEARTDEWIDELMARLHLPRWVPTFVVKKVLDSMFPEKVLNSLEALLLKTAV